MSDDQKQSQTFLEIKAMLQSLMDHFSPSIHQEQEDGSSLSPTGPEAQSVQIDEKPKFDGVVKQSEELEQIETQGDLIIAREHRNPDAHKVLDEMPPWTNSKGITFLEDFPRTTDESIQMEGSLAGNSPIHLVTLLTNDLENVNVRMGDWDNMLSFDPGGELITLEIEVGRHLRVLDELNTGNTLSIPTTKRCTENFVPEMMPKGVINGFSSKISETIVNRKYAVCGHLLDKTDELVAYLGEVFVVIGVYTQADNREVEINDKLSEDLDVDVAQVEQGWRIDYNWDQQEAPAAGEHKSKLIYSINLQFAFEPGIIYKESGYRGDVLLNLKSDRESLRFCKGLGDVLNLWQTYLSCVNVIQHVPDASECDRAGANFLMEKLVIHKVLVDDVIGLNMALPLVRLIERESSGDIGAAAIFYMGAALDMIQAYGFGTTFSPMVKQQYLYVSKALQSSIATSDFSAPRMAAYSKDDRHYIFVHHLVELPLNDSSVGAPAEHQSPKITTMLLAAEGVTHQLERLQPPLVLLYDNKEQLIRVATKLRDGLVLNQFRIKIFDPGESLAELGSYYCWDFTNPINAILDVPLPQSIEFGVTNLLRQKLLSMDYLPQWMFLFSLGDYSQHCLQAFTAVETERSLVVQSLGFAWIGTIEATFFVFDVLIFDPGGGEFYAACYPKPISSLTLLLNLLLMLCHEVLIKCEEGATSFVFDPGGQGSMSTYEAHIDCWCSQAILR